MAFKKINQKSKVPSTPALLFRELTRRKFPDVLPHQKDMMERYAEDAVKEKDVALQLPTGSGKTLVGLLIAEWRRKKFDEKIVYLCPTKQLVNQVVEQAFEKYGLNVKGFTGSKHDYPAADKARYKLGNNVAVTTYSSLFNTNPYFAEPDIVIIDDAHAAENYVAKLWTLEINRLDQSQESLHTVICSILKPHIDSTSHSRMTGNWENLSGVKWVDKIPTNVLIDIHEELTEILDEYAEDSGLHFSWVMLREHLKSCHIYISHTEIVIRPIMAPTWDLPAFINAKQRLYMSATLGEGGDLERLMGRKSIYRLPVPDGWDLQGVGRRFFMFPSLSLEYDDELELRRLLLAKSNRSLILVPNDGMAAEIIKDINDNLSLDVFKAEDIELSKSRFVNSANSVAIVANRYDGIDFPGDECRLLVIEGLPKAVNLQENFFMRRMGANTLYNERIQTRVLQAIGRCTRSLEDYSAVVVTGDELPEYLSDKKRRSYFHPELQAEITFGVKQSQSANIEDFVENFDIFIENGDTWEDANNDIVQLRNEIRKRPLPSIDQLSEAVKFEVKYQMSMWQKDYTEAVANASEVIAVLTDSELRGYRALWEYLAGSAAKLAASDGNSQYIDKSIQHYKRAKNAAKEIPWLVKLSKQIDNNSETIIQDLENQLLMLQIENIEEILTNLGMINNRGFNKKEHQILEGLEDPNLFEESHREIGELLGFDTGKIENEGSPDPWWKLNDYCLVFEDHANAKITSSLSVTKARQVSSHPNWMRENITSYPWCI